MSKKILSLILSGVLLSQIGCFCTFAEIEKVDYCRAFPKNQYNQTVNVGCAFDQLVITQKGSKGTNIGEVTQIGPNGKHEIKMWHVDQIQNFAIQLADIIFRRKKSQLKNEYIESLSDTTNKFLSLNSTSVNSTKLAERVTQKLLIELPWIRGTAITTKDIESWEQSSSSGYDVSADEIEKWKREHDKEVEKYKEQCSWFDKWFGSRCDTKVNNTIKDVFTSKAREDEIKASIYSSVVMQTLHAIYNGYYKGKDTLVAKMDFSEDNNQAQVYFTNIGLKNQEIKYKDVEPILAAYSVGKRNEEEL